MVDGVWCMGDGGWEEGKERVKWFCYYLLFMINHTHSHFDDTALSLSLFNFHSSFFHSFHHLLLFGGHGFGKYSQMLFIIKSFSPSGLKFENKIYSTLDKQSFFINISDFHFEVDMGLLGCNYRNLRFPVRPSLITRICKFSL